MSKLLKAILIRLAILVALVCGFLLAIQDVEADTYVSGMVGVFNSGKSSLSEVKFLNVGFRQPLGLGLSHQYEVGGWTDRAGSGRKMSGYGAWQIGVEAGDSVVARVMVGPALISHPDSYLGGHFQFTEDFYLGLKGNNGNSVGLKYKHFSSGGIYEPNIGRDLLGAEIAIPF